MATSIATLLASSSPNKYEITSITPPDLSALTVDLKYNIPMTATSGGVIVSPDDAAYNLDPDGASFTAGPPAYYSSFAGMQIDGTNPAFFDKLHDGSTDFWIAILMRTPTAFSNMTIMGTGINSGNDGMRLYHTASGVSVQVRQDTGIALNENAGRNYGASKTVLCVFTADHGTRLRLMQSIDGAPTKDDLSATGYSSTNSDPAGQPFHLGTDLSLGSTDIGSTARVYWIGGGQEYMDITNYNALKDALASYYPDLTLGTDLS